MGNANSGRRPDQDRRQRMLELREQGLSLAEIGRRLRITKQGAGSLLARIQKDALRPPRSHPVRCDRCRRLVWADPPVPLDGPVPCLRCLAGQPDATFGRRLRAHRVAAKLTLPELARRTRLHRTTLDAYERDVKTPAWPSLTRLLGVLGLRLLQVPPVRPVAPVGSRRRAES
jgi:transcriptional regulator with XRE-family HTH domain